MRHSILTIVAAASFGVSLLAGCGRSLSIVPATGPTLTPAPGGYGGAGSPPVRGGFPGGRPPGSDSPPGVTVPMAFTAVSATHWWVLGSAPCGSRECLTIETTTDGGATFTRLPAPGGPFGPGLSSPPAAANIRFADPEDGWVFGPRLYATHDGGRHWAAIPMPGQVTYLEPGLGAVFAIVNSSPPCATSGTCTSADTIPNLWSTGQPAIDQWQVDKQAGSVSEGLTVHGRSVWVVNSMSTRDGPALGAGLLYSADSGGRFTLEPAPIMGIACFYSPVSDSVIWSYCSGGHFMFAYRSTDGGAHFSPAAVTETTGPTPNDYPNGSTLVAAAAAVAIAAGDQPGDALIRTTDAGGRWTVAQRPPDGTGTWSLIGFTTPEVGYALWQHQGPSYPASTAQLWHTTDGGATWSPVTI